MNAADTTWYRTGTISIETNSLKVFGTNTLWLTAGINSGATLRIDGTFYALEILQVVSDTEIDLRVPYTGETVTDVTYSIDRNFQATVNAQLVAHVIALINKYGKYIDSNLQKLIGPSAYEIWKEEGNVGTEADFLESLSNYGLAKKNGYTGTLNEWLESLKAAGEWTSARDRLSTLEEQTSNLENIDADARLSEIELITNNLDPVIFVPKSSNPDMPLFSARYRHNMYPRFKNLGNEITEYHRNIMNNPRISDLYIGDFWELQVGDKTMTAIIVQYFSGWRWMEVPPTDPEYNNTPNHIFNTNKAGVHIALDTGYNVPFKISDNGYKSSIIRTEILPEILENLENLLGAEHIYKMGRAICNNNQLSFEQQFSKLELFHLNEMIPKGFDNLTIENQVNISLQPYPLYTHWLGDNSFGCAHNGGANTWVQETIGDKATYVNGGAFAQIDPIQSKNITAHFLYVAQEVNYVYSIKLSNNKEITDLVYDNGYFWCDKDYRALMTPENTSEIIVSTDEKSITKPESKYDNFQPGKYENLKYYDYRQTNGDTRGKWRFRLDKIV